MSLFWDTSAVLSLLLKDANGKAATGQAARTDVLHITTPFVTLEAENRLHALRWKGEVTDSVAANALTALERFVASHLIRVRNLKDCRLIAAESQRMIRHFSRLRPHKTMDIIHVASARLLKAGGFFTFDSNQAALAKAAGFQILRA